MNLIYTESGDDIVKTPIKPGICMQVFRFNFADYVMDELTAFAKIHEHDNRLVFKDAWKVWMSQNKLLIHTETERLVQEGFTGNVIDKMYKSVRYYFRKKSLTPSVQPQRKTYDSLHKPLLSLIDEQIYNQINANLSALKSSASDESIAVSTISPAEGFDNFCNDYQSNILDAIRVSHANDGSGGVDSIDILPATKVHVNRDDVVAYINKIKKTYKNRFYNIKVLLTKT